MASISAVLKEDKGTASALGISDGAVVIFSDRIIDSLFLPVGVEMVDPDT